MLLEKFDVAGHAVHPPPRGRGRTAENLDGRRRCTNGVTITPPLRSISIVTAPQRFVRKSGRSPS